MFNFHLHGSLSFDCETPAADQIRAAAAAGLQEICFTDHFDQNSDPKKPGFTFTPAEYRAIYDAVVPPAGLTVRRGLEFGLTNWNQGTLAEMTAALPLDFVIGSVHVVDGWDPYEPEYWEGKTVKQAFTRYLEAVLDCVRVHDGFDVLGHLNYVCKAPPSPTHEPLHYEDYRELTDEILRTLVRKGRGLEINTSGLSAVGEMLPGPAFLRRFRELGGEIVTVGTDAHTPDRIAYAIPEALALAGEIFGHVCTFQNRQPVFHKL